MRPDPDQTGEAPEPRLSVRGPVFAGFAAFLTFAGFAAAAVLLAPVAEGVLLKGAIAAEQGAAGVAAPRGGTVAKVYAVQGQMVEAGELLIGLETQAIDQEIAAMTAELEAARKQLELARIEASTMSDLIQRKAAGEPQLEALQTRVAGIEKEVNSLTRRIAVSQEDLDRSAVRAPTSGRVASLAVSTPGAPVQAGMKLIEVVPVSDVIALEGEIPAATALKAGGIEAGQKARVHFDPNTEETGTVVWVSEAAVVGKDGEPGRIAVRVEVPRVAGTASAALNPGHAADIRIETGRRTLMAQWQDRLH